MSQQFLYGLGQSIAKKQFKFVLSTTSPVATKTLKFAPKGWNDSELTFIRDKFYKGVLESYSTNELTFVKDGRDFIQAGYELGGIDYEITIDIYILVNSTFKYQLYFSGKLDLSTYKIDSIGVTCEIIPTGFQNTVLNRDDIEVDMMSTKFIGGGDGSMEALSTVWEKVDLPAYQASQNADWRFNGQAVGVTNYAHYLPMTNYFTEFAETEIKDQSFDLTDKFFTPIDTFTGSIKGTLYVIISGDGYFELDVYLKIRTSGGAVSTVESYHMAGTDLVTNEFVIDESVGLGALDSIYFEGYLTGTDATLTYSASSISVFKSIGDDLPTVSVPMFYIYEAFVRTIQLISGVSQPFYSEFLGRVDSVPESYLADGTGSLMTITSGLWLRDFNTNTTQLNFSLKDLFKTINAIWNIGLGFETVDGVLKVRVEDEKYFFDIAENPEFSTDGKYWKVNQVLDLSMWLNNEMISKEVLPDWYANEISGGYGKYDYENIQGLKEFNTESKWALPIKSVKSTLDLKSEYRADTQGVNKLRAKPFSTFPTEDVSGDNDTFIFDVKRLGTPPVIFTVKTDEDFTNVSGGIDPQQCYNLNFTPRRNLERHGNRFDSMRLAAGDEIQWLKSDKNTALVTQKSGEAVKPENGDILASTLIPGYWLAEAYNFEAPVNEIIVKALQDNPRGVIKIAADKWGWILDVQTNNETEKGTFKLLRCDTDNVRVIYNTQGIGVMQIENDFIIG